VAQLASALAWGARGRPFKSDHPDKKRGGGFICPFFQSEMYTTYILYSPSIKKYYTGQTTDPNRRIEEHNRGKTPFIAQGIQWQIVFRQDLE